MKFLQVKHIWNLKLFSFTLFPLQTSDYFHHILDLSFNLKTFLKHIVRIFKPTSELSFDPDIYYITNYHDSDLTIMILFWEYCFCSNGIDSELLRYCWFHYIVKELDCFINVDQICGQTRFVVIRPMCALDPVIELVCTWLGVSAWLISSLTLVLNKNLNIQF